MKTRRSGSKSKVIALAGVLTGWLALTPGAEATTALEPVPGAHVKVIEASSSSPDRDPRSMTDGHLGTGWVSDPGQSVGQTVTLRFETTRYLTRVDILPGLGRDNVAFKRHARPSRIKVAWDGGEQTFEVWDRRRAQPLMLAGMARTRELRVTVEAVHGSAAHGVAISEITGYEPHDILAVAPALRDRIEEDVAALGAADDAHRDDAMARVISYGRPVVPWLVDHVTRGDARTSPPALEALLALDPAQAQRLMRDALQQGTRAQVAIVLRCLEEGAAGGLQDALVEALDRLHGELADAALDHLASTGDHRALPRLETAILSGDPRLTAIGAARLGLYEAAGREVAGRLLASSDPQVRLAAVAALGSFDRDPAAVSMLEPLTAHPAPRTRLAAIRALGRIDVAHARAALGRLIEQRPAGEERATALAALIAHDERALPLLRELLSGGQAELQGEVVDGMASARTAGVRSLLVDAVLSATPPSWQRQAVRALAAHGQSGIDALLTRIRAYPEVAPRAEGFLKRVASSAARSATAMLLDLGPDREFDHLRSVLVETVRSANYEAADRAVVALYGAVTTSARLRREALSALGHIPTQRSKDTVLAAMDHADPMLARLALQSAGRLGDRRAIPKLMRHLEERHVTDWSPDAVEALGALRAEQAVPLFQDRMSYASRGIKLAILRACDGIGGRGAVRILIDASISSDVPVARTAHQLLSSAD